jgi:hypothetical protein
MHRYGSALCGGVPIRPSHCLRPYHAHYFWHYPLATQQSGGTYCSFSEQMFVIECHAKNGLFYVLLDTLVRRSNLETATVCTTTVCVSMCSLVCSGVCVASRVNYTVNRPVSGKKKPIRCTGGTDRFTETSKF